MILSYYYYYYVLVWISKSLGTWQRQSAESTMGEVRVRSGIAVWRQRGRVGKVCAAPYHNDKKALNNVGASLCRELTFK